MAADLPLIARLHTPWIEAVNAGDLARLLSVVTDDVLFISTSRAAFGRDEVPVGFLDAHQRCRIDCQSALVEAVVWDDVAYPCARDGLTIAPHARGATQRFRGVRITV